MAFTLFNQWKKEWRLHRTVMKFCSFTLTVSSTATVLWQWPAASCSAFDRNACAKHSQKVVKYLSFQFLIENSLMSLWVENLLDYRTFWSIFYRQNSTYFICLCVCVCLFVFCLFLFGIESYAYTESHIGQIPCVCMYVCDQTPPKPLNRFT